MCVCVCVCVCVRARVRAACVLRACVRVSSAGKGSSSKIIIYFTADQLMTVIKKLSGKPLYLRMDDIKNMLSVIPEVVCQLEDMVSSQILT